MDSVVTIGALSARTGVAHSALRYYEDLGLIRSTRTPGGQRRYSTHVIRRVSFIRAAQQVGLSLEEIADALSTLPSDDPPSAADWSRLAASWRPRLDAQIAMIERLRDRLDGCIGCGCLSMAHCALLNPGDVAAAHGTGPRYVLADDPTSSNGPP
jgi:MerR family redox-sensitive transcriptional activator SoxR